MSEPTTRFVDGPAGSPGFQLWRVTLAWQREMTSALAPLGLTHVQFVLLTCTWWLTDAGAEPSQVELARQAGADVKMTSQVLRTLEAKELIVRRTDPADTRTRRIALTRAGTTLVGRAVVVVEEADQAFFGDRAPAALRILRRLPGSLGG